MKVVGNSKFQKKANSLLILNLLREKSYSRLELSNALGLQPSTMTYSINRLLKANLVKEKKLNTVLSGRPPIELSLNQDFGRIIGIELLSEECNITITDFAGNILLNNTLKYNKDIKENPIKRFKIKLEKAINYSIEKCKGYNILACSVAIPGITEKRGNKVVECWTHQLNDSDFTNYLNSFDFSIKIENDANCCASKYLNKYKNKNYIYVDMNEYDKNEIPDDVSPIGIGYGIVINGSLYRGSNLRAGEFHSSFCNKEDGKKQVSISNSDLENIKNDEIIQEKLIIELLKNLRYSISILDPNIVLLGGDLSKYKDKIEKIAKEEFKNKSILNKIKVVDYSNYDSSDGAAILILNKMTSVLKFGESESIRSIITDLLE